MDNNEIVHFLPSEEIFEKAVVIFEEQKAQLEKILPQVDIQHVGSRAVPGAIGKFDIDVQIRVTLDQFEDVIEILSKHFTPKHPNLWTETLAIFHNNGEFLIDIVVTMIGSEKDICYYGVRDVLIKNPELLTRYNSMKIGCEGKTYEEYRNVKQKFLIEEILEKYIFNQT
ncbi:MAG TPA: GrpB family protein [Candidatus Paceibacterota bacterium]